MRMTGQESIRFVYPMTANERETARILLRKVLSVQPRVKYPIHQKLDM